ncbi:hypothetical protein C8R46DRAFT_1235757 [Mycena filopes]|nr:hypothetical protein C8R46DRAFT_1235757 [Mycena filopes]
MSSTMTVTDDTERFWAWQHAFGKRSDFWYTSGRKVLRELVVDVDVDVVGGLMICAVGLSLFLPDAKAYDELVSSTSLGRLQQQVETLVARLKCCPPPHFAAVPEAMKRKRRQDERDASSSSCSAVSHIFFDSLRCFTVIALELFPPSSKDVSLRISPRRSMVASLDPRRLIRGVVVGLPSLEFHALEIAVASAFPVRNLSHLNTVSHRGGARRSLVLTPMFSRIFLPPSPIRQERDFPSTALNDSMTRSKLPYALTWTSTTDAAQDNHERPNSSPLRASDSAGD